MKPAKNDGHQSPSSRIDIVSGYINTEDVQWLAKIGCLIVFIAAASGLPNYVHLEEHLATSHQSHGGRSLLAPSDDDGHDESRCSVCMNLHAPFSVAGHVPLLVFFGLLVAFLTLLAPLPVHRHVCVWIESRGPPAW